MRLFFALLVTATLVSSPVAAHAGGTDAFGCHAGSRPYHCHGDGGSGGGGNNAAVWIIVGGSILATGLFAAAGVVVFIWYYNVMTEEPASLQGRNARAWLPLLPFLAQE